MGLGWWMAGQFRKQESGRERLKDELQRHISEMRDALEDQLRYHERLDDARFNEIKDRLSSQDLAIMKIELREQGNGRTGPHEI